MFIVYIVIAHEVDMQSSNYTHAEKETGPAVPQAAAGTTGEISFSIQNGKTPSTKLSAGQGPTKYLLN